MSEQKTNLFEVSDNDLSFNAWAADIMEKIQDIMLVYSKSSWTDDTGCKVKSLEAVDRWFEAAFLEALNRLECNMFYQFLLDCIEHYGIELDEKTQKQLDFWIALRK